MLYHPAHFLSTDLALSPHQEQDLHVYIFPEHLYPTNPSLKSEIIWGSNPYSPESDAVCILQHSGLYDVLSHPPPSDMVALKLVMRIHPGGAELHGTERHAIRSKNSVLPSAVCLSALQFHVLRESNELIEQFRKSPLYGPSRNEVEKSTQNLISTDLASTPASAPPASSTLPTTPVLPNVTHNHMAQPAFVSANPHSPHPPPSLPGPLPTTSNNSHHTKRPLSSRRSRRSTLDEVDQRVAIDVLPDTILQFNLSNELSFQYNLNLICDRGIEPSQWTSHRLRKAVLMVETSNQRYELSWEQEAHPHTATNAQFDTYRFALVTKPFKKTRTWHATATVPLPPEHASPIHTHLDWSQLVWGPATLTILGSTYHIRRIFWIARSSPPSPSSSNSTDNPTPSNPVTSTSQNTTSNGM